MSKLRVFAVQDLKIGAFVLTFNAATEGAACRAMQDLVQSPSHAFGKHAEDFNLYEIGLFDETSGVLEATPLRSILNFAEFK